MNCLVCQVELDEAGFAAACPRRLPCRRDLPAFENEVKLTKESLSLQVIAEMEKNSMPESYTPIRAEVVAMAKLLMQALRQNQTMMEQLRKLGVDISKPLH